MNYIEFDYKKLRTAQDLPRKTLELIGMKLLKKGEDGVFKMPDTTTIASYLNRLAVKRKIKHYVLKGEYEDIYLFCSEEIKEELNIMEVQAQKTTEIIKIQCYDKKVSHNDTVPIEISKIQELFKLPESLFNSGTCIYFLCEDGKVVYIGQAENVHSRLMGHIRTKVFDSVFYLRVQANKMSKIESSLISYLKPEYNQTGLSESNQKRSMAESILNTHEIEKHS